MRDVAKAAGLSTGTVYRMFRSKDELLVSIMETFAGNVAAGWDAVVRPPSSTPVEQLDALMWVNINLLDRFSEEFKIQLAWLRQSPPDSVDLGLSFGRSAGPAGEADRRGPESRVSSTSRADRPARARSMYEVMLTPDNVVRHAGPAGALELRAARPCCGARW